MVDCGGREVPPLSLSLWLSLALALSLLGKLVAHRHERVDGAHDDADALEAEAAVAQVDHDELPDAAASDALPTHTHTHTHARGRYREGHVGVRDVS